MKKQRARCSSLTDAFTIFTERQRRYLQLRMQPPWPDASKCARLAGYSESVARTATRNIDRAGAVAQVLKFWNKLVSRDLYEGQAAKELIDAVKGSV